MTIDLPDDPSIVSKTEIGTPGQGAAFVLIIRGDPQTVAMKQRAVKQALDDLRARMEPPPCRSCGDAAS